MTSEAVGARGVNMLSRILGVAMIVWAFVVVVLMTRFLMLQFCFMSALRHAAPFDVRRLSIDVPGLCQRAGVRRAVRFVECDAVSSPAVWGVFRPIVILPKGIVEWVSESHLEWILLHELVHIRRHDLAVACFQWIMSIVHFVNPAVWVANRMINRLREYACDDMALSLTRGTAIDSSEAFLRVVRRATEGHPPLRHALGAFDARTACFRRVARLLDTDRRLRVRLGVGSLLLLLSVTASSLPRLVADGMASSDASERAANAEAPVAEIDDKPAPSADDETAERVSQFFKRLKAEEFVEAAGLFDMPLRAELSGPELNRIMAEFERRKLSYPSDAPQTFEAISAHDRAEEPTCGKFQEVLATEKKQFPGGPLWESRCRWENAVMLVRVALNEEGQITVFWLARDAKGPTPESFRRGGYRYGRSLDTVAGLNHAITVRVVDIDGTSPEKCSVGLWKAVDPTSASEKGRTRLWHVRKTGTYWQYHSDGSRGRWENGCVTISGLTSGIYRATASGAGFQTVVGEPIELGGASKQAERTLRAKPGSAISVRLIDVETKNIALDTSFRLIESEGRFPPKWSIGGRQAETGEPCRVEHLPPGNYRLTAGKSHVADPADAQYEMKQEAIDVTIEAGEDREITVPLRRVSLSQEEIEKRWPFVLTGTVTDAQGRGLKNAEIKVWNGMLSMVHSTTTLTDAEGRYTLRFVPGSWRIGPAGNGPHIIAVNLVASRPGYVWKREDKEEGITLVTVSPKPKDSAPIKYGDRTLAPDETLLPGEPRRIDLVMAPAAVLKGRLLDEAGRPIVDQWISLKHDVEGRKKALESVRTDEDGRFAFAKIPPSETFWISTSSSSPIPSVPRSQPFALPNVQTYSAHVQWAVQGDAGREARLLRLTLADAEGTSSNDLTGDDPLARLHGYMFLRWIVEGTIRDGQGQPLEGVEVILSREERRSRTLETVTTDSSGRYHFAIRPKTRTIEPETGSPTATGETVSIHVSKDGYFETSLNRKAKLYLADDPASPGSGAAEVDPSRIIAPETPFTFDRVMKRPATIAGQLLDEQGHPLPGYSLLLTGDVQAPEDSDMRRFGTDVEGRFRVEEIPGEHVWWFQVRDLPDAGIDRTNSLHLQSGQHYNIVLRIRTDGDGLRLLRIDRVTDTQDREVHAAVIRSDQRAHPLVAEKLEKEGRDSLRRMAEANRAWLGSPRADVQSLHYRFRLGDDTRDVDLSDYHAAGATKQMGITFSGVPGQLLQQIDGIRFRSVETVTGTIRLFFVLPRAVRIAVGNGIERSWRGYSSRRVGEGLLVIDATTYRPLLVRCGEYEEKYSHYGPLGEIGHAPLRIQCRSGVMRFDFRFRVHEEGPVWLFDRSIGPSGELDKPIAWVTDVRMERPSWVDASLEEKGRDALRRMGEANRYWFKLHPEGLPEFAYTFHLDRQPDRRLTWDEIRNGRSWYAEFYRKGISYIGLPRLLAKMADTTRFQTVEITDETITLEFAMEEAWMNAVGNGIAGTWLGWFNGVVRKGVLTIDAKTHTPISVKTEHYEETYSNFVQIKPGQFVPRRIVVDKSSMLFDFRFKVYEPCLWLFDHSLGKWTEGDEEPVARISAVTVDGQPAREWTAKGD